jgi:long-subunit acyl-CoA synthetase (AMP-forming)
VLADRDTAERIEPCRKELEEKGIRIVYYDEAFLKTLHDTTPIPNERTAGMKPDDIRALIYTSGTTGEKDRVQCAEQKRQSLKTDNA